MDKAKKNWQFDQKDSISLPKHILLCSWYHVYNTHNTCAEFHRLWLPKRSECIISLWGGLNKRSWTWRSFCAFGDKALLHFTVTMTNLRQLWGWPPCAHSAAAHLESQRGLHKSGKESKTWRNKSEPFRPIHFTTTRLHSNWSTRLGHKYLWSSFFSDTECAGTKYVILGRGLGSFVCM